MDSMLTAWVVFPNEPLQPPANLRRALRPAAALRLSA